MAKKRRRSPLEVLEERAAEIDALEKKRDRFQRLADGGNAAAALAVIRLGIQIASIVRQIQRRRKNK